MSENQNNQNTNRVGNTHDVLSDLRGQNYANLRKAIADGFSDANSRLDPKNSSQSFFQDRRNEMEMQKNSYARKAGDYKRTGSIIGDVEEGIKDALLDSLAGSDFKKGMQSALSEFSKQFGFELKDLPHEYGKHLGNKLFENLKNTKLGNSITTKLESGISKYLDKLGGAGTGAQLINAFKAGGAGQAGSNVAGGALSQVAQNAKYQNLMKGIDSLGAKAGAVGAIIYIVYQLIKPALSGIADLVKAWTTSWNKDEDVRKKRLENAQKRVEKDYEYLAREPFEILTNAAKKWEEAWDSNLAKISLTQGYTKEDVYDLFESVSKKLDEDNLTSAIAATDIINNLSSVLEAGLSGTIAEEFAYEATKLGAAIPTQNFMGYASTYAQLASEAVSRGATQKEAIEYANEQLETFASNLLYSSRTLTGGFTTGLQDAQALFKDAVDIAQTAKTSNAAQISGTLTAVSGVIGAVAPDLAQGLVQNIVDAAIGGNSDTIVALRSLAGINASNTEFLRKFASDPQGVFVSLFQNLANLQSMSPDNYMEVAEGLSSVFGIDMKALARVDFNQLATQIANMQVNQASLTENLDLLESGEATMSTEQVKLQEINNMILEEGLAYVIDSEAGRAIQEHMWEEQISNAMMENEYAVNLQGAALSFLEGIRHAIANILNFLNPIGYIANGVSQMIAVEQTRIGNNQDIQELLELTAVGTSSRALNNLLTTGQDLQLVSSLVEMYGGKKGTSSYWLDNAQSFLPMISAYGGGLWLTAGNPLGGYTLGKAALNTGVYNGASFNALVDSAGGLDDALGWSRIGQVSSSIDAFGIGSRSSLYSGFSVGKAAYEAYKKQAQAASGKIEAQVITSATQAAAADNLAKYQAFLDSAEEASKTQSFDAWLKNGNIDIDQLEELTGITKEQLKGYYEAYQSGQAGAAELKRKEDEQQFRDDSREFYNDTRLALSSIQLRVDEISEKIGDNSEYTVISVLGLIYTSMQNTFVKSNSAFQKCLSDWIRYMAEVKSYQNSIGASQAWSDLVQAEGAAQQETLLALANAMQVFSADELKKLDPQLQANVLLGQIVVILQTMMQQNSTVAGGISLPETLSALGFGMTFKTGT